MTASNFTPALAFTLRYEGGKADNPKDPGGRTNEGVTQRIFTAWLAGQGQPARDVYRMTDAERDAIYRRGYWVAVGGDALPPGVDLAVFDYGVNSGPSRALKAWAKRPSVDAAAGVKRVCADRLSLLHALATFKTFGRGWTARVAACEALVKMAEHAAIGVDLAAPATLATASKLMATSRAAAKAARGHAGRTAGALTLLAAGGATQGPATPAAHLPLLLLLPLGGVVAAAAVLLLWRAHQQKARAAAYAGMAAAAAAPRAIAPAA